jgi:NAD(P)-dependent dehydrogenase (short-subunit alcohol dehydrogenase family)
MVRMTTTKERIPNALVTGASQGFGRALAHRLADDGWRVLVDARDPIALDAGARHPGLVPVAGDVTDPLHRLGLAAGADVLGGLDLLVNNASALGPSPLPALADYPVTELRAVLETNVLAPLALTQLLLPSLRAGAGVIVNISSDAAVEPYEGWGGYAASKAALDQLTAVLGVEEPGLRVYAFDPGDMRTGMHQRAFPGEDISDRPEPATVVPALLRLIGERPSSGRYRAVDLLTDVAAATEARS